MNRIKLLALTLSIFTSAVFAAPATPINNVSWTAPTTRLDGSPLAATEISGYRFYCNAANTTQYIDIPASSLQIVPADIINTCGPVDMQFFMTTLDTNGLESPPSETFGLAAIGGNLYSGKFPNVPAITIN